MSFPWSTEHLLPELLSGGTEGQQRQRLAARLMASDRSLAEDLSEARRVSELRVCGWNGADQVKEGRVGGARWAELTEPRAWLKRARTPGRTRGTAGLGRV